jgi:hypothetical protein
MVMTSGVPSGVRAGSGARLVFSNRDLKIDQVAWHLRLCNCAGLKVDEAVKSQNPDGFEKSAKLRRANL